ncbi:MAG TPA: trigger factor [Candidatus Methylomirabilis sp.]|nr:trigger factor [Candidatus Methylomirabilis sp.]
MKVDIEEINSTKRALRIELPPQSLLDKLEAAYRHLAKEVRLPGFRPGKVPRDMLRLHFREQAKHEALRELIPESYTQALKDADLNPVSEPKVDEVVCEEGQPLRYRASFEIRPILKPSGYAGIEVYREKVEVDEAEVDKALEYLRERAAEYVPMDGWPALREDLVVVDYEALLGGKPLKGVSGQNVSILLGARQFMPEFEEQLHGLKKGEVKEFPLEFPADHPRRELAGKRLLFRVAVKEVKKKRVPPLDNDFAKSAGECETVPGLREKVMKDLLAHKEREQEGRLKDQILDKLLAATPFDAPESLVDGEAEDILADVRRSLAGRGLTAALLEEEVARGRAKATELARKRVRSSLFLEAVAEQEQLVVSEEEVNQEVRSLAAALNQESAAFSEMMRREGRLEGIRRRLLERKTLDFLYQRANVAEGVNLVTLA